MKLVKTSLLSGFHTFIKLVTNVIIGKVFAIYLGPAGITQLGNFMNLFNILNITMTGGVNSGVVKFVAENKNKKNDLNEILSSSFFILLFFSFITILIVLFNNEYFTNKLFNNDNSNRFLIIGILTAAFFSSFFSYLISVFNGLGKVSVLTALNIFLSILTLVFTLIYVRKYFVAGVIYTSILSFAIVSGITLFVFIYRENLNLNIQSVNWSIVKKFLQYSLMAITSAICVPFFQILIRDYYTEKFGINIAGNWQALVRMSESYLSIFSTILITYFLPKYSEIEEKYQLREEIKLGYKYLIPTLLFFFFTIYILREFIVSTLYSKQFLHISDLFSLMFVGDFLKICSWILAFLFLAKSKTKIFIVSEVVFSLILFIGTLILSPYYDLMGYVYSYILCYFLYLIFCVFYFRRFLF